MGREGGGLGGEGVRGGGDSVSSSQRPQGETRKVERHSSPLWGKEIGGSWEGGLRWEIVGIFFLIFWMIICNKYYY